MLPPDGGEDRARTLNSHGDENVRLIPNASEDLGDTCAPGAALLPLTGDEMDEIGW